MDIQQRHKSITHREKYFHYRPRGEVVNGATLFARQESNGLWYGAVSFCSLSDNFCRKTGRTQARRKYFKGLRFSLGSEPTGDHLQDVVIGAITETFY